VLGRVPDRGSGRPHLDTLVSNPLGNTRKFTPADGRVRVEPLQGFQEIHHFTAGAFLQPAAMNPQPPGMAVAALDA